MEIGQSLIEGVNAACEAGGLSYRLEGVGPMPTPKMDEEDKPRCIEILKGCLRRGFYIHPGHAMFLSLAHTKDDVEATIRAVEESVAELKMPRRP